MFVFPFGRPEIASRSFLHFRSKFCRRFWLFQVCFQFVRLEIGSLIVLHFRSEICRRCWLFHVCFSIRPTRNSEQDGSTFQIRIVLSCFVVSCLFFNLSDSKQRAELFYISDQNSAVVFGCFMFVFQFVRLEIASRILLHFKSEFCCRFWLFHACFSICPTRNSEQNCFTFQIRLLPSFFVVSCLFFNLSDSKQRAGLFYISDHFAAVVFGCFLLVF